MCVCLRAKFEVSSIILTSLRKEVILPPSTPPQNKPLKSPPRLGLKRAIGVNTFNLAAKLDLASFKASVDKLDVDKLKTAPGDLSKLNNVVVDNVVKKTVYDEFFAEVNAIDITKLVKKN